MGEVCIIPDGLECCLGQRMVLLKPNKKRVLGSYLLYALQSEFVQTQIQKSDKTGSIVSNLRIPVLEQLNIPVFDTFTQEKIGSILQNIDSKIEINNRINALLEEMAKTIYDFWFVQFDFPDKNGKPYKTSGGKMVWNEELKREIPEGWEVLDLQKIAKSENIIFFDKYSLICNNVLLSCVRSCTSDFDLNGASFLASVMDFATLYPSPSIVRNGKINDLPSSCITKFLA